MGRMGKMKGIVGVTLLLPILLAESTALPQHTPTQFRGTMKAKQTTPTYFSEGKSATFTTVSSSSSSPSIGTTDYNNRDVSKPSAPVTTSTNDTATRKSQQQQQQQQQQQHSLSAIPISTTRDTLIDATEASSASSFTVKTTEPRESTTASQVISTMTTRRMSATTNTSNPANVGGSSAPPTETSSRTIVTSIQDSSTFLSSSKKSTTNFNHYTTTPAAISAKETRESTGKIRPQIKLTTNYTSGSETGVRLPEGASAALAKPTKYHYYPHNQHIYLLPECAVQQVCNAVYVRLNFTQPLCACPGRYRDPCSASLDSDDLHTTELVTDPRTKALTLVKTCEPVADMRECRAPRDWSLLALQNVRTGKSHYLVICRCPDANILEGPMSHDQPMYASVPGIRVYGMMCVQESRRSRPLRYTRSVLDHLGEEAAVDQASVVYEEKITKDDRLSFPWYRVRQLMNAVHWD